MKVLRLGTRKSALAQTQTAFIAKEIIRQFPEIKVETILITTTGDRLSSSAEAKKSSSPPATLSSSPGGVGGVSTGKTDDMKGGLKALFTKELEEALLQNKIDLAVHSLKDMSAELPEGLVLGAVPERENPQDAWISRDGTPFSKLGPGAKVGTGSTRRNAQLQRLKPDLTLVPMRGNVDTRLKKLKDEGLDGIILAVAGIKRLGREREITEILAPDVMLPAVGQGALAVEIRDKDLAVLPFLKALDHPLSHQAVLAERAFLIGLGGSCQTPIAGLARHEAGKLILTGLVLSRDGKQSLRDTEEGRPFDAAGIGERLAAKLLAAGAGQLLGESGKGKGE